MVFQPLSLTVTLGVILIMYRYVSSSLFYFYRADGGLGLQLTSNGFEFTANFNVRDSPHTATDTRVKAAHGGSRGRNYSHLFSAGHRGGRPATARTKREQCVEINIGLNNPSYCLKTCSSTAGQPGFCFYYRKWLQCLSYSTVHYTHSQCVVGEIMVVLLQLALDPRNN